MQDNTIAVIRKLSEILKDSLPFFLRESEI